MPELPPAARPASVTQALASAQRPLLVVIAGLASERLASLDLPHDAVQVVLGRDESPDAAIWGTVALLAHDRLAFRRALAGLPTAGPTTQVICWLGVPGPRALSVLARPDWPAITELRATLDGSAFASATFADHVPARSVLLEFARSVTNERFFPALPAVPGLLSTQPQLWPPGRPNAQVKPSMSALLDPDVDVPPDHIVGYADIADGHSLDAAHPVIGNPAVVVVAEPPLTWADAATMTETELHTRLARGGLATVGPIDEQVLNPTGFNRHVDGPMVKLEPDPHRGETLATTTGSHPVSIDTRHGPTESDITALRTAEGIELGWQGGCGPHAYARVIASLAAAGIPLAPTPVPQWARCLLDGALVAEIERPLHGRGRLSREERSIRQRRAALGAHAAARWRGVADPRPRRLPAVSAVLATKRPEMLKFALRQVGRQRGLDLELVVATHGFEADRAQLAGELEGFGFPVTFLHVGAGVAFGDVLNRAAAAASHDVLVKVDDDDWYGPDFVADLLLARMYSSADLVGCSAEFNFVEPLWLTVRRRDVSEAFRPIVAGGTMMLHRVMLEHVGGFRAIRKFVDASLLSAVQHAGGTVYRSHGLNYVLRRAGGGHTWDPGLGYFLRRAAVEDQWRGFAPSALLEADAQDLPVRSFNGRVAAM